MTTFVSFNEWLDKNRADFMVSVVTCPECKGEGQVSCRCCGSELECNICDGTGKVNTDDGELVLDIKTAKQAYTAAQQRDIERLKAWA